MSVSIKSEKHDLFMGVKSAMERMCNYLSGRRGLIVLAVVVLAVGLVAGWPWLVAAGVAPILLALAPCAVMCGLGLCMSKMGGKGCSTPSNARAPSTEKLD